MVPDLKGRRLLIEGKVYPTDRSSGTELGSLPANASVGQDTLQQASLVRSFTSASPRACLQPSHNASRKPSRTSFFAFPTPATIGPLSDWDTLITSLTRSREELRRWQASAPAGQKPSAPMASIPTEPRPGAPRLLPDPGALREGSAAPRQQQGLLTTPRPGSGHGADGISPSAALPRRSSRPGPSTGALSAARPRRNPPERGKRLAGRPRLLLPSPERPADCPAPPQASWVRDREQRPGTAPPAPTRSRGSHQHGGRELTRAPLCVPASRRRDVTETVWRHGPRGGRCPGVAQA